MYCVPFIINLHQTADALTPYFCLSNGRKKGDQAAQPSFLQCHVPTFCIHKSEYRTECLHAFKLLSSTTTPPFQSHRLSLPLSPYTRRLYTHTHTRSKRHSSFYIAIPTLLHRLWFYQLTRMTTHPHISLISSSHTITIKLPISTISCLVANKPEKRARYHRPNAWADSIRVFVYL